MHRAVCMHDDVRDLTNSLFATQNVAAGSSLVDVINNTDMPSLSRFTNICSCHPDANGKIFHNSFPKIGQNSEGSPADALLRDFQKELFHLNR